MSASTCFAATPAMAASEYTRALRFVVSSSTVSRNASRDALAAARFAAASSMRAWFSGLCSTAGGACGGGGNLGSSARSGSNVSTKDDRMECVSASSASALATGAVTPSEEGAEKLQLSGSGRFPPHVRYATTASHTHATATNSTATWVLGFRERERGFRKARGREAVSEAATNGGREISNATVVRDAFVHFRVGRDRRLGRQPKALCRARTCVMMELLCSLRRRISAM